MRIGPLELNVRRFAEPQTKGRPPLGELGTSGANIWRGLVAEEYNPDLRGPKAFETYDKMLRSDGQVQAIEFCVTLPIGATGWYVEPGDDSAAGREAADLIQSNLFGGMSISFDEVLRHALLGAFMGVELMEKVWEIRDGAVAWRKLAPRHPKSIYKWETDVGGGVQGVVQIDQSSGYRQVTIPIEKLILFTFRGDHGNPEGRAMLRPAYKHWFIKDWVYKFANIAVERLGVGTPIGHLPEGYTKEDQDDFLGMLNDWKASDSGAFALPPGYTIEILEAQLRLQGFLALIEHHDILIARSVLAQFINLGSTASGSRALSEGQSKFFLLLLDAVADWFALHINRYAIPQWCAYNYPGLKPVPTIKHASIGSILSVEAITQGLSALTQARLLTPGDDIENVVREMFELPALPEEHTRAIAQPNVEGDTGAPARASVVRGGDRRYDPRPHVKAGAQLTQDETHFDVAMRRVIEEQHTRLLEKIAPIIADFKAAPDAAKGRHITRMQEVRVPLLEAYRKRLSGWLWTLYSTARDRAAQEFGVEPGATSNQLRAWMATKAQVLAAKHGEDLRAALLLELLEQVRQDIPTDTILANLGQVARRRAGIDLDADLRQAGEELIEVINGALLAAQTGPTG